MKNLMYLLIFSLVFGFVSCEKDEPTKPDLPPQPPPQPVDTSWFSLQVKVDISYQHERWYFGRCQIYFTREENVASRFESHTKNDVDKSEYVDIKWEYEKEEAQKHIKKKRFVLVRLDFLIPGTSIVRSFEEWREIEVKHGENVLQFEFESPP